MKKSDENIKNAGGGKIRCAETVPVVANICDKPKIRVPMGVRTTIGKTSVYTGAGISARLAATIKPLFGDGAVAVVFESDSVSAANAVAESFKADGVRPLFVQAEDGEVPEHVRFIFAVGSEQAADKSSLAASRLKIDWSILLTSPDSDNILFNKSPKQVFIDENIMLKCGNEKIASGWGIVLSEPIKRFEDYFSSKVLDGDAAQKNVAVKYKDLAVTADAVSLAIRLLEISHSKKTADTAEIMADILTHIVLSYGKQPRLPGEYKFICSAVLDVFYRNFLGSPAIDVLPPRDRNAVHDKLCLSGIPREKVIKRFDIFDTNSYFRISYTLGEYRTDLLERLSGIDLHSTQRFWRRLYSDAGYWLKGSLNAKLLTSALALAGEFSGGLLGFAAASGITDIYL